MHSVVLEDWTLLIEEGGFPRILDSYLSNAKFVDQIRSSEREGRDLFLGLRRGGTSQGWPEFVITQKYDDASGVFHPGFLIVPETSFLFIGAGERLLGYNLKRFERAFEDHADCGFWGWTRQGDYVLMSAELEFGVWKTTGEKLWSTFVEPPWSFRVSGDNVELDVMGERKSFKLETGAFVRTDVS